MRVVSADLDEQVASSSQGDRIEASVFRSGVLVAGPLEVQGYSLAWDASRQVQGQCTLVVADPDGDLAPWGVGDPLGVGGSRVLLSWVSGTTTGEGAGIRVPLGRWRIRKPVPRETWRVYGTSSGPVRVPGGGSVTLSLDEDVTCTAVMERLDAEVVPVGATVLGEVRRLLQSIAAVDASAAPPDVPVPATLVYGEGRLDGVEDLLDMIGADHRAGPDGALQVVPAAGVGPVWTIEGGESGALVEVTHAQSDEDVYNAVVSRGTDASGSALVGRAYITAGPLAWGGAFGKVPLFHQAIAKTQAGVDAGAATTLENRQAAGTVDLPVECLAHPGVQVHDLVTVVAPTRAGDMPLVGRVVAMSWASAQSEAGSTPGKTMSLTVRVTAESLEAVAAQVARG